MKTVRTCPAGHTFSKSSDCPTCPECERERKPAIEWRLKLAAPANRALDQQGITTLAQLAQLTKKTVGQWHGIGPKVLHLLTAELAKAGLAWKED